MSKLPGDYYNYDESSYSMTGERTGRKWKLGQPVEIVVAGVDKILKNIDFEMIEEDEHGEDGRNKADCE